MRRWICALVLAHVVSAFAFASSSNASAARLISSKEPGWPQFRGPRRDGISVETKLLQSWPEGGPRLLWSAKNIGRGYSSPTIVEGRLYITGDVADEVHILAHDLHGKLLWTATNGAAWKNEYPGARSTVTYSGGDIYHQNAHGHVTAFDAASGQREWSVDLLKQFGGENIQWGLSECLLVDGRSVYATAGGKDALVVALDKKNGAVIWKSDPLREPSRGNAVEHASYVSPILVEFAGRRLLIGCSQRNLYCVDAANGALQWTQPMPTAYSVLAMPPALVDDAVFMTAPHGRGGRLLKLLPPETPEGKVRFEELWTTSLDTCQGGVIYANGKIFGSFYSPRKGWAAVDAKTGAILYQQGEWVKGCALFADNRLYALSEDGWMRLLEPAESEFKKRGEFRLARAQNDAWAHPVIHNGRLYLRYHEELFCYDVKSP